MNICVRPASRDQRGVTLIELMVTMALLAGFLIILSTLFTNSVDIQAQTGSYAAVTSDGRIVLSRLEYDIKRASAVTTPDSPGDTDSSLVLTIGGSTYTYSINNNRLQLDIDGSSDYITGDQTAISSLSFQELGADDGKDSIRYSFTVTGQTSHETDSQTFTSTTELRP